MYNEAQPACTRLKHVDTVRRRLADVEVFVRRYATGERGELIVFFHHPITKILQFDGVTLDGDSVFKTPGQE